MDIQRTTVYLESVPFVNKDEAQCKEYQIKLAS